MSLVTIDGEIVNFTAKSGTVLMVPNDADVQPFESVSNVCDNVEHDMFGLPSDMFWLVIVGLIICIVLVVATNVVNDRK